MRILPFLTVAGIMALAQPVWASGYLVTYESGKLSAYDGMKGVKGAKRLEISWAIPTLPVPGKCQLFDWPATIVSYTDGKNTMASLLQKYVYNRNEEPYLSVCLKRDSQLSQTSTFVLLLYTNTKGVNYSEYLSYHSTFEDGRNAILAVQRYKSSMLQSSVEDESRGGRFTVSAQ